MKRSLFFLFVLVTVPSALSAEWYQLLPPGIFRTEVLQIAGKPSSTRQAERSFSETPYVARIDRYELKEGYVELSYDGEVLTDCTEYSQAGGHRSTHYSYFPALLSPDEIEKRRSYLDAGQFASMPDFRYREFIRTKKYPGSECYPIDHSLLIISPLLDGQGFFAGKTARVILLDDGRKETVLYRAIDNWNALKPPGVDDNKLKERARLVKELPMKYPDRKFNIVNVLGPPDSTFGSGIPYVAYYLEDGLVVGVNMEPQLRDITIRRPGDSP